MSETRQRRRFRWTFKELLPSWLREGEGEAIGYTLGSLIDGAMDRYYWALVSRYPSLMPADAAQFTEQDRRILRGVREPLSRYAGRAIRWLDAARVRGGTFAMLEQIREFLGGEGIRVRSVDASGNWYTIDRDGSQSYQLATGNWKWDGIPNPPNWSRFWIIVYPRLTPSGAFEPWDKPPPFDGSRRFDGSFVWGSTATPEEIGKLRALIQYEKPAGTRPEWLIYYYHDDAGPEPDAFDPAAPEPDGTWWAWGSGDPHDLKRAIDAAYIKAGPTVTPDGAMIPYAY